MLQGSCRRHCGEYEIAKIDDVEYSRNPVQNYYTSAHFEGLTGIDRATIAWTWNVDSKCGRRGSIDYYKSACLETERSRKDGYGAYWGITPSYGLPLPTATALANSSAFVGARGEVLAECRGSVAPDIYHIKLSTDSPAIPVARKAFEVMASATNMKRDADDLQVGEFADRETGLVKAEKLAIVQETLEKYGDGLTSEQIQALNKLRG